MRRALLAAALPSAATCYGLRLSTGRGIGARVTVTVVVKGRGRGRRLRARHTWNVGQQWYVDARKGSDTTGNGSAGQPLADAAEGSRLPAHDGDLARRAGRGGQHPPDRRLQGAVNQAGDAVDGLQQARPEHQPPIAT